MPPFVPGFRFRVPSQPIYTVPDPLNGRISKHKYFSFFLDPKVDLSDWVVQANLFLPPRRTFGVGMTSDESAIDLLSLHSSPLVTEGHPVIQACIKNLPRAWACCPNQQVKVRFCKNIWCAGTVDDFVYEENLNHIHVGCESCKKAAQIKFLDKDFVWRCFPDDTVSRDEVELRDRIFLDGPK